VQSEEPGVFDSVYEQLQHTIYTLYPSTKALEQQFSTRDHEALACRQNVLVAHCNLMLFQRLNPNMSDKQTRQEMLNLDEAYNEARRIETGASKARLNLDITLHPEVDNFVNHSNSFAIAAPGCYKAVGAWCTTVSIVYMLKTVWYTHPLLAKLVLALFVFGSLYFSAVALSGLWRRHQVPVLAIELGKKN